MADTIPGRPGGDLTRARQRWLVLLGSFAFAIVGLASPFGRDQGNYAYPAWAWLDGQMPYRDVYVFKPPATVWVHALAQALFGHTMQAVRILDLAWTAATALVIAAIVRRWTSSTLAPPLAGVLYAFLYANFDFWNTCQTDGWFNLPAAGAILLTTRVWNGESKDRVLFGAGALVGLAMVFKYTAAALVLPIAALLLADAVRTRAPGKLALRALLGLTGILSVLGGTLLWLKLNGALPAFLETQLGLVPAYVANTGRTSGLLDKWNMLVNRFTTLPQLRFVLAVVVPGLAVVGLGVRRDPRLSLPLAWFLGGLVSTMAQDKYFRYHFLSQLPGAAILGALAIQALLTLARQRSVWVAGLSGALIATALIAPSGFPNRWESGFYLLTGRLNFARHWARRGFDINQMSVKEVTACAARVAALTRPDEKVFVWGFDPMINYVAERKTVSRFLYNYPFAVSWGNPAYEAELLAALEADPPAVFVVASRDATPHATGNSADSRQLFEAFTALESFVETRYGPPEAVHRYSIYRRKP